MSVYHFARKSDICRVSKMRCYNNVNEHIRVMAREEDNFEVKRAKGSSTKANTSEKGKNSQKVNIEGSHAVWTGPLTPCRQAPHAVRMRQGLGIFGRKIRTPCTLF
ncbi:unnamed protein product [Cuscuta epithymum]|uniref:Uncharacterized protein n=1 Tax=Cuscuta epithymum TaxID=186058 RepID=A0AAV0FBJ0_9ASTE|nr:unnamed protein product [Cuscuta epithymum]